HRDRGKISAAARGDAASRHSLLRSGSPDLVAGHRAAERLVRSAAHAENPRPRQGHRRHTLHDRDAEMTMSQDRDPSPAAQDSPDEGQAPRPLWPRRAIIRGILAAPGGIAAFYAGLGPTAAAERLASIPAPAREKAMRRAMSVARGNPAYPFGAVITR